MLLPQLLLSAVLVAPWRACDDPGTIRGTVVNGSHGNAPVAAAEVILQAQQDGSFIPLAKTATDEQGRFVFDGLPAGGEILFLPAASRDAVYYPGDRVRLDPQRPEATADIRVFDAVTDPSPLVARRHEIVIRTEPNLLNITETVLVSNPSSRSYVGAGERPVTLRLRVPSNFEKITFDKEFYGRRFVLIDGVLLTTIPWPPGERELKFDYIVPIEKQHQVWERPLDLPSSNVRVTVVTTGPNDVSCNLPSRPDRENGAAIFESNDSLLPAGHVVHLELGRLRVPVMTDARWIALGILACLIAAAAVVAELQRRRSSPRPAVEGLSSPRGHVTGRSRRERPVRPRQSRPRG